MARPPNPLQAAALEELLKHLRVGADIDLVRPKFATVPKPTYWRWVQLAQKMFAEEGGQVAPPAKQAPAPVPTPSSKPPKSAKATAAPKGKSQAKSTAVSGVLIPGPDKPAPEKGAAKSTGFTSEDGSTYTVMTMFGPKESSIVSHFTEPPETRPLDALALVERIDSQFTHAEALMKSAMKRVGDGHAIIDSVAFAAGVDLQLKSTKLLHAVLKDVRNLDSVRRFLELVFEALRKEQDKVFAQRVSTLLRESAKNFVPAS